MHAVRTRGSSIEEQIFWRDFYESYAKAHPEEYVLFKNQVRYVNGQEVRGFCGDAWEAEKELSGNGNAGFCLDLGAALACGLEIGETIAALEGRIEVLYWPLEARLDISAIVRGLLKSHFSGLIIFDLSGRMKAMPVLLRESVLAEAEAVIKYMSLMYDLPDKIKAQESLVLFGAGNMCRNYLRIFGGEKKPLFICDNDQRLWGSYIEGIEVKPPRALKEIKKETAIFICNMYYQEIEQQLREMGLENPMEFYTDEAYR